MALETNTLVNGAWTTQTVDVNEVLRHYNQQDKEADVKVQELQKAPVLGLLTQTVIKSPLVHWILPVRLRDSFSNDVAFIGDNFVQIKELRTDGHLWDVFQKENFGARIRNATVIGSLKSYEQEDNHHSGDVFGTQIKNEDHDIEMDDEKETGSTSARGDSPLPPQALLLQLDNGVSVFLMLRRSKKGEWEFVSSPHRVSKAMMSLEVGTHLAVDPSSRYMAIGCSEGLFAIYALNSRETLKKQHSGGSNLQYVQAEKHCYIQGVIHEIEFLYPGPKDDDHIILLVLVVLKGRTRMLLYEWQAGKELRTIRAHSHKGYPLEESHQMPLLVIPLTIRSSFILVSENSMATCNDILLGSPKIVDFDTVIDEPTPFFHGSTRPLWVAWTRPMRRVEHTAVHDDIYIVREDGLVKHLEIQSEDDLIAADNNIGTLQSNCGTALASLDYSGYAINPINTSGDLLIMGGDSCGGGTYLIKARREPEFQQIIQNWTPAMDIVTTSSSQDRDFNEPTARRRGKNDFPNPDKIYACIGKGLKGEVIEFRHGLEGHIGLEMEFHTPIMDVWVLQPEMEPLDGGSDFLLSLGDCSALLHLSSDAEVIHEIDQDSTAFDLRYRTIAVSEYGNCRFQVTEKSIVFIHGLHKRHIQEIDNLLRASSQDGVYDEDNVAGHNTEISSAVIYEGFVLFAILLGGKTFLQVQEPTMTDVPSVLSGEEFSEPEVRTNTRSIGNFSERVTSLAICLLKQEPYAIVAEWTGDATRLTFQPLNGTHPRHSIVPPTFSDNHHILEEYVSITASSNSPGSLLLLCGTRNGIVVMLQIDEDTLEVTNSKSDRIGATSAIIKRDQYSETKELFFINSDSKLYAFTTLDTETSASHTDIPMRERTINRVWLTDVTNPSRQQPKINSVARLPINTSADLYNGILLVDGSQLLIAGLNTQEKPVPRHIPIRGTPSRLLYSRSLDALIVGAIVNGKSTILFIDPETGSDISRPFDKNKNLVLPWVAGLGNQNERIFRLLEWSYVKDGKTWYFIIVCTSTGRFIMISTEKEDPIQSNPEANTEYEQGTAVSKTRPKIRYWTRYKWKCENPIYSAVGFADGIFYCSGKTLHCEILDLAEKKFKPLAQYELPSTAINLTYEDGKIYALTATHSLEILELVDLGPRGGNLSKFVRTHGDQVTRPSLHNRIIGRSSEHPLQLISDRECSVVGLWATYNTRADTLDEVFEAELPYSILRFRAGNCRPVWDPSWASNQGSENAPDYPEILGLSMDGSLCHFTVLDFAAWKFLRFIVNRASQSPRICEFTHSEQDISRLDPVPEPKLMMHVDGDILRRCLEHRCLEDLLQVQNNEEEGKIQTKFRELLEAAHPGELGKKDSLRALIERAYKDLQFLLRPVL